MGRAWETEPHEAPPSWEIAHDQSWDDCAAFYSERGRALREALRGFIAVTELSGTRSEIAPQMERAKSIARAALAPTDPAPSSTEGGAREGERDDQAAKALCMYRTGDPQGWESFRRDVEIVRANLRCTASDDAVVPGDARSRRCAPGLNGPSGSPTRRAPEQAPEQLLDEARAALEDVNGFLETVTQWNGTDPDELHEAQEDVRELQISDEAVEAAARAEYEYVHPGSGPWPEMAEPEHDEWTEAQRIAIQAFLQAEGFEVERRGQFFPDEKRKGIQVHRDTEQRLVSPWKPISEQGTDTPSTTRP